MIQTLSGLLRLAGTGLILLAVLRVPIGRRLNWSDDVLRLTPVDAAIFRVHNFFICLVLVMMGLPCVFDPAAILERSRAGAWLAWSCAVFWAVRLYFQWFVYSGDLWRGKRLETHAHWCFTVLWTALLALFAACGCVQAGWLR